MVLQSLYEDVGSFSNLDFFSLWRLPKHSYFEFGCSRSMSFEEPEVRNDWNDLSSAEFVGNWAVTQMHKLF